MAHFVVEVLRFQRLRVNCAVDVGEFRQGARQALRPLVFRGVEDAKKFVELGAERIRGGLVAHELGEQVRGIPQSCIIAEEQEEDAGQVDRGCLLYTSPSPRD